MSEPTATAAAIRLRGVRQNNLRGFDLDVPLGKLVVITGVSGSGKSSLAFDTLYAEGQRRYVECLSSYARQFMERMDKPAVDEITGILPSVALRQGKSIRAARATVATLTELGEYFRLVFAQAASPLCPTCGAPVHRTQVADLVQELLDRARDRRLAVTFALPVVSQIAARATLQGLAQAGFHRAWQDGQVVALETLLGVLEAGATVHVLQDRLVVREEERARLYDSLQQALRRGAGTVSVWLEEPGDAQDLGLTQWLRTGERQGTFAQLRAAARLKCANCGTEVQEPSAHLFSSSSAVGACPGCNGFGRITDIDLGRVIPDVRKSLKQGAIKPWSTEATDEERDDLVSFATRTGIQMDTPWQDLAESQQRAVIDGEPGKKAGRYRGVRGWFKWQEGRSYKMHVRVLLARYRAYTQCPECLGTRLKPEALAWKLGGQSLPQWLALPVRQVREQIAALDLSATDQQALEQPLRELRHRVDFLDEVGLEYLSLDRAARTLSGGELQRVQLVAALATGMTQVLYVLDEPSVGLHPRDNDRLLRILERLRAAGNTVVVVEHDPALIRAADVLIDLGPGAGAEGGELLYVGSPHAMGAIEGSLTADYLSGRKHVVPPNTVPEKKARLTLAQVAKRKELQAEQWLTVRGATARTLRGQDVQFKLGALNAVCGVSGSGKSTLVEEVLYRTLLRRRGEPVDEPGACEGIDGDAGLGDVVLVDQELPHGSSRANCATYLKVWDAVRNRLADEPLAISRGYTQATFSFNREGGRCPVCEGLGFELVEMQFLSDVRMTCEACEGHRFRADVLQVQHRGLSASEFLDRTAAQIAEQFQDDPALAEPMRSLCELGLGYLRLGQPLSTLSGGEAQRLKIAWHLLQARTKNALFLLDEPSTGLHLHDVAILLHNLRQLTARGNTVILVEHHLDLIAAADHVVELGPEGGPGGGEVLYQGDAQGLLERDTPTARFLRHKDAPAAGLTEADTADIERDPGLVQIRGAKVHNLQDVSLDIPRDRFVVVTGLSGSGKSSLAFDVVFAEGQRRFLDCLSPYARQYLPPAARPDVDKLAGLPPTVAIAQRTTRGGLRSTVATLTDIYPYLRLLYARCGTQLCPNCAGPVSGQTAQDVAEAVTERFGDASLYVMAPAVRGRKGHHKEVVQRARSLGHDWLHVDGCLLSIHAVPELRRYVVHDIDYVVARLPGATFTEESPAPVKKGRKKVKTPEVLQQSHIDPARTAAIAEAVDQALALGDGTVLARTAGSLPVTWSLRRHCARCDLSVEAPDPRLFAFTSAAGWCPVCTGTGLRGEEPPPETKKKAKEKVADGRSSQDMARAGTPEGNETIPDQPLRLMEPCPVCQGSRLRPEARSVTIGGHTIDRALALGPPGLAAFLDGVPWNRRDLQIAQPILAEVGARCRFLDEVGLDYLALGRGAPTLSGGESQRIRLAAQLSSNLRGVLYVLDEPTIGLHPADNEKVLHALEDLVARGSGLLVVEHDEDTIRRADHVIELGPGGGRTGGMVTFQGSLAELLADPHSPTGAALRLGQHRRVRDKPRSIEPGHAFVTVKGATRNNLRDVTVGFARGRFNVVTGVSGSGKSTLVRDLLVAQGNRGLSVTDWRREDRVPGGQDFTGIEGLQDLGRIVEVDQSPIGRTPRSCPATYMGLFDDIRKVFANIPEAKVLGLGANQFSFNVEGGRCEQCQGAGQLKVEMSFLPTVFVPCETCGGARYTEQVRRVLYKGASIADVLRMSIAEAADHFGLIKGIAGPLRLAERMGLGYLSLGQGSNTLSGGEAQRLKIVTELCKRRKFETLYVLDEPSTGLHLQDLQRLLDVLHELVDRGDTLVVIEHQLDIVREADWLVDMGPGAGERGGHVTWQGTVQGLLKSKLKVPTRTALLAGA
jgi:excinuclease ABC subunit A